MSWTTPRTWTDGEHPDEIIFNTHVRDNLDAAAGAGKAAARVFNSANISLTNATATRLTFDSERFDTQGLHSTSTNTGRLTVPTGWGGLYIIGFNVAFAASTTGVRQVWLLVNNTTIIGQQLVSCSATSSDTHNLTCSTIYRLAAADYVEVWGAQSSGGSLNVTANASYSPEFWAVWIGA